jgi:hypothetical protein
MRISCRLSLMVLVASASAAGAQSALYPHFGNDAEPIVFGQAVSQSNMRWLAQKTLGSVMDFLAHAKRGENAVELLPSGNAVLREIPGHKSYRYAVVGSQRLIVDAATHSVIYRLK